MYQKTSQVEKPYTQRQIENLRSAFDELEKAKHSKSVEAYTKKVLARLKGGVLQVK